MDTAVGKKLRQPTLAERLTKEAEAQAAYDARMAEAREVGARIKAAKAARLAGITTEQAEATIHEEQVELLQLTARQNAIRTELETCRERKQVTSLRREAQDLVMEVAVQKVRIAEARLTLAELPIPAQDARDITDLREQVKELQEQSAANSRRIVALNSQINHIQAETADRYSRVPWVRDQLQAAQDELENLTNKAVTGTSVRNPNKTGAK